jgi:phosphotransferase family enzyme
MNPVARFLDENWSRLGMGSLERVGPLSVTVSMPPMRNRVIYFVFSEDTAEPILVAKLARTPEQPRFLCREAENLDSLRRNAKLDAASAPRLVTFEEWEGRWILVESVVRGWHFAGYTSAWRRWVKAVLDWLIELHTSTVTQFTGQWFDRLALKPLAHVLSVSEVQEIDSCRFHGCERLLEPLAESSLRSVFEHGDFGSTNVVVLPDRLPGVVDWEYSEPHGLPALDLFFFLVSVAITLRRASRRSEYLAAFHDTFFGPDAWGRDYVAQYSEALSIPPDALKPLFVLAWVRYLNNLLDVLIAEEPRKGNGLSSVRLEFFRRNYNQDFWRYTLDHLDELNIA